LSSGCAIDCSVTAALPNKLDGLVLDIPVLNRLEVPAPPNILDFPVPLLLLDFCTDIFDVDFLIASYNKNDVSEFHSRDHWLVEFN
jgi:hypothetical protein